MTSLYIHIPFCQKKCLYCSFVVSVGQAHRVDDYLSCLEIEAQTYAGTPVGTVYVGGGTPTFMNEDQLVKLAAVIKKNFIVAPNAEMTIEANPEGIDRNKAAVIAGLGFNRISLGVQSVQEKYLQYLGRCHGRDQAVAAYENFRAAGCKNINLDLMYAFPHQTSDEIEKDVRFIASLRSEHVSIYALTVEENSRFYAQRIVQAGDDVQAGQYELVAHLLNKNGVTQYEISNFARPGCESRHNIHYWTGGDYIGLGVGAHSHRAGERFWNVSRLNGYIENVRKDGGARDGTEKLSQDERFRETLLFGLRMSRGVNLKELEKQFSAALDRRQQEKIESFVQGGLLEREGPVLRTTGRGRVVLDEISAQLI